MEALGFLMLKYAFSHILETHFLSFWQLVQHQKLIKIVHYFALQSIWDNFMLLHTLKIYIFYTFMKKICLWLFDLRSYAEWSKAKKFYDVSAEK